MIAGPFACIFKESCVRECITSERLSGDRTPPEFVETKVFLARDARGLGTVD